LGAVQLYQQQSSSVIRRGSKQAGELRSTQPNDDSVTHVMMMMMVMVIMVIVMMMVMMMMTMEMMMMMVMMIRQYTS
jgi:sterol desaturase/sphingolipid hydroxylase (fatty acid hydroxylase superfamily)